MRAESILDSVVTLSKSSDGGHENPLNDPGLQLHMSEFMGYKYN